MSLCVVTAGLAAVLLIGVLLIGSFAAWAYDVLTDEEHYLAAVVAVPRSATVRRWSGRVVAFRTGTHVAGGATRLAMGTRPFRRTWLGGHRLAHRHRGRVGGAAGVRLVGSMLAVAALGDALRSADAVRQLRGSVAAAGRRRPVPGRRSASSIHLLPAWTSRRGSPSPAA